MYKCAHHNSFFLKLELKSAKVYQDYQTSIYMPVSKFVFNPFMNHPSLVMPIDTLFYPKGILQLPLLQKKMNIEVSTDWTTITLYEIINGKIYQIPYFFIIIFYGNYAKTKVAFKIIRSFT